MNPLIQLILTLFESSLGDAVYILALIFFIASCLLLILYLSSKRNTIQAKNEISKIKEENEQLRQQVCVIEEQKKSTTHLERELRLSLKEVARLQNALAEANVILTRYKKESPINQRTSIEQEKAFLTNLESLHSSILVIIEQMKKLFDEQNGVNDPLKPFNQEPMAQIMAESHHLLEQIDQINQLGTEELFKSNFQQGYANIEKIIEQAISLTVVKIREKDISLRVDLPENLPAVHTDKDVIQKVITTLLDSACAITPPEGTVNLKIRYYKDYDLSPALLIQTTDRNDDSSESEMIDLFSKADAIKNDQNEIIDTSSVFSDIKSLVKAQGGKIWIDCKKATYSSFHILLPLQPNYPGT